MAAVSRGMFAWQVVQEMRQEQQQSEREEREREAWRRLQTNSSQPSY